MKKVFFVFCSVFLGLFGMTTFAVGSPDSFQLEVNPATFSVNQPVDFTVKAIKNGQIMKDYEGRLFLEIEWDNLSHFDYTLPEGGFWEMKLSNQGVKTYSKGLQVKKAGTFVLKVEDLVSDSATGTITIIVSSDDQLNLKNIQLLSPLQNGTETESSMSVMANAPELSNSRIQVYLNDLMVKEAMTDTNGLFNETIPLQKAWTNVLELKAVGLNNQIVGLSDKRTFLYQPLSDNLFKSITMTPNQNLKIWDKVRFEVFTDERVSSAKLLFSWGQEYPLDKEKDGLFTKNVTLTTTGEIIVNAEFIASELTKKYDKVLSFSVRDHIRIGEVRISLNPNLAGTLDLSWVTLGGESSDYAVKYWLEKDQLIATAFTKKPQATLSGFSYGKSYFFQVLATTPEHVPEGLPSQVIQFDMPILSGTAATVDPLTSGGLPSDPADPADPDSHDVAVLDKPLCVVKNIQFSTKKIWNKHYLVRNKVANVEKYLIYRSEYEDGSDRQFVGESLVPRYEYPFDNTAEEDIYAYYDVEAICNDGEQLILTKAEKVKVGPFEDMLMILACTFLIYLMYRLYHYNA